MAKDVETTLLALVAEQWQLKRAAQANRSNVTNLRKSKRIRRMFY